MKIKLYGLSIVLFVLLSNSVMAWQNTARPAYYYIVANAHYSTDYNKFEEGFSGLINVEEAENSADSIELLFKSWGARFGTVLKSTKTSEINSKQLLAGLDRLINTIKSDKVKNPIVYFYYAGHGFSSKKLQALFLPNGDFTRNPDNLTLENWGQYATVALDIHEKLQGAKLQHMMFFDCCYSGMQENMKRLSKQAIENFGLRAMDKLMGDSYKIFEAMYQMVGPDPVIFSTKAGETVVTVPVSAADNAVYVAPLCRRLLQLRNTYPGSPVLQLDSWMNKFLNKGFDPPTSAVVSYWSGQ